MTTITCFKIPTVETEFATAVCAKLGVEPKFVEINWDAKLLELESKNIDCIWNGMTITGWYRGKHRRDRESGSGQRRGRRTGHSRKTVCPHIRRKA